MVAAAALAAVVAGTSSGRTTADKPTIAFVSQGTSNSWAAQLDAVAKKTADKLGVNLVYYNGQGDATKQLPELQRAIATKPDALVRRAARRRPRTPARSSGRWRRGRR